MSDREELVRRFLADSDERVERLLTDLAALEPQPELLPLVDAVRAALGELEATCATPAGAGADDAADSDAAPPVPPQRDLSVVIASPLGVPVEAEAPPVGQLLVERGAVGSDAVVLAVMQQGEGDERPLGEILVAHGSTTAAHVADALEHQAETKRSAAGRTVRVDVDLLDALLRGTSALAQSRDDLLAAGGPHVSAAARDLDAVTDDLQECAAALRRRPVSSIWAPLARLARDRGAALGKPVRVRLEGGGTQLDRAVLDALGPALAQCLRSAVDHGIESPAQRRYDGKPAVAQLVVRAGRDGDGVVVEVVDDGCGDTAAGLDAVGREVEQLGGRVDVVTVPGCGTTVRLAVPLSWPVCP